MHILLFARIWTGYFYSYMCTGNVQELVQLKLRSDKQSFRREDEVKRSRTWQGSHLRLHDESILASLFRSVARQ